MKKTTIIVAMFMLLVSSVVFAGIDGGGGMTVTCFDKDGKVISTELLDVFEAKMTAGDLVTNASGSLEDDYFRLVNNTYTLQGSPIAPQKFKDQIIKSLREFLGQVQWTNQLPFLNDQGVLAASIPENCQLEQIAIFSDSTDSVRINMNIWQRLDTLSQAALIEHELLYKYERLASEFTSESTRSYVRQILAPLHYTPLHSGLEAAIAEGSALSTTEQGQAFLFDILLLDKDKDHVRFQFTGLLYRPLLVKAFADVPKEVLILDECTYVGNRRECYPTKGSVSKIYRIPIQTEHRQDWELVIRYIEGQPITFTLLQHGTPIGTADLSYYRTKN